MLKRKTLKDFDNAWRYGITITPDEFKQVEKLEKELNEALKENSKEAKKIIKTLKEML